MNAVNCADCLDPTWYCGNGPIPVNTNRKKYFQQAHGTRAQCVKIGYGAGKYGALRSQVGPASLMRIPYVDQTTATRFQNTPGPGVPPGGITTIALLGAYVQNPVVSPANITAFLTAVSTNGAGVFHRKTFNAILYFLYSELNLGAYLPLCILLAPAGGGGGGCGCY